MAGSCRADAVYYLGKFGPIGYKGLLACVETTIQSHIIYIEEIEFVVVLNTKGYELVDGCEHSETSCRDQWYPLR